MERLKARVTNGRLILNEPTDLPEGTVLDLVIDDEGDDLTDEEREELDAALKQSLQEAREGKLIPASEVLEKLRRQ